MIEGRDNKHVVKNEQSLRFSVRWYNGHRGKFHHTAQVFHFWEGKDGTSGLLHERFNGKRNDAPTQETCPVTVQVYGQVRQIIDEYSLCDGLSGEGWPQGHKTLYTQELQIKDQGSKDVKVLRTYDELSVDGISPSGRRQFLLASRALASLAREQLRADRSHLRDDPFRGALETVPAKRQCLEICGPDDALISGMVQQPTAQLLSIDGAASTRGDGGDQDGAGSSFSEVAAHLMSIATSTFTMQSTLHSRERLLERDIPKEALQKAVKYAGHLAVPGGLSRSGRPTLLVQHNGIVSCTDASMKTAITAWRVAGRQHDLPTSSTEHCGRP